MLGPYFIDHVLWAWTNVHIHWYLTDTGKIKYIVTSNNLLICKLLSCRSRLGAILSFLASLPSSLVFIFNLIVALPFLALLDLLIRDQCTEPHYRFQVHLTAVKIRAFYASQCDPENLCHRNKKGKCGTVLEV